MRTAIRKQRTTAIASGSLSSRSCSLVSLPHTPKGLSVFGINRQCVAGRDPRAPSKQIRNQLANTQHAAVRQTDRFRIRSLSNFRESSSLVHRSRENHGRIPRLLKKNQTSEFRIPNSISNTNSDVEYEFRWNPEKSFSIFKFKFQIPHSLSALQTKNTSVCHSKYRPVASPPLLRHSEFQTQ